MIFYPSQGRVGYLLSLHNRYLSRSAVKDDTDGEDIGGDDDGDDDDSERQSGRLSLATATYQDARRPVSSTINHHHRHPEQDQDQDDQLSTTLEDIPLKVLSLKYIIIWLANGLIIWQIAGP